MSKVTSLSWIGKQKQVLLIWLAAYPTITGLVWILDPVLSEVAIPVRTLILSALMVPIMVYGATPLINKWIK
ncbi:MAG: hypothetical protein AAF558_04295 [Verrucomicrobiota bacterium]